jgi:hypothetical protein
MTRYECHGSGWYSGWARAATAGMMSPGRNIELAAPTSQPRAHSQPAARLVAVRTMVMVSRQAYPSSNSRISVNVAERIR